MKNDIKVSLTKIKEVIEKHREQMLEEISALSEVERYIYVPSIKMHVAEEKTLHNFDWNESHLELQKQGQQMLTLYQLMKFIKYLKNDYQFEEQAVEILYEMLAVRTLKDSSRAEHIDAYFKQREDGLYILTENKTKAEKLESCLMENCYVDFDLTRFTKQGLPRQNAKSKVQDYQEGKNIYYWHPRDGGVTWFSTGCSGACL